MCLKLRGKPFDLKRLNIDIAALQETRLPPDGSLGEQDYNSFNKGRNQTSQGCWALYLQ